MTPLITKINDKSCNVLISTLKYNWKTSSENYVIPCPRASCTEPLMLIRDTLEIVVWNFYTFDNHLEIKNDFSKYCKKC